jgi:MFS family permease
MRKSRQKADSFYAYLIIFTAGLFFFCESILVNTFGTLSLDIMSDFHINAYELGKLSASYLFANILLLFPAGILLDRVSVKQVLLLSIATCSVGAMIFSQTVNIHTAIACIFISGMGGTFCFLGTMKLASRWFSTHKLAWITGLIITLAMMGGLVAQTPTALLANTFGWRSVFQILSVLEAMLCLASFFILKDSPKGHGFKDLPVDLKTLWKSIQLAVKTPLNWFCGIFTSTMNLPVTLMGAIWGVPFLIQAHGFSRTQASSINALIFVGMIIGPTVAGSLSDYFKSRTKVMFFGVIISLGLILNIIFLKTQSQWIYSILFFALGLFSSVQILGYTVLVERTAQAFTGASLSISCVLVMSGGTFLQPLFGKIMQHQWDGKLIAQTPVYSAEAYQSAMIIFPIAFIIALFMTTLLNFHSKDRASAATPPTSPQAS